MDGWGSSDYEFVCPGTVDGDDYIHTQQLPSSFIPNRSLSLDVLFSSEMKVRELFHPANITAENSVNAWVLHYWKFFLFLLL